MKEIYEFLKECNTYYLATVNELRPRVRPFGTINLFEGKLYIQTGKVKSVSKQIEINNYAEICAYDGKDTWIRIETTLVEDDRIEARESMLEAYPNLKDRYSATDGNTQVFYLKDAKATFESFGQEKKVIKF